MESYVSNREYSVKEIVRVNDLDDDQMFLESILQNNRFQFANAERANSKCYPSICETISMILALSNVESIVVFIYDIQ